MGMGIGNTTGGVALSPSHAGAGRNALLEGRRK